MAVSALGFSGIFSYLSFYKGTIGADVVAHLGADYLSGIILLAGQPTIDFDMSSRVPSLFVAQILPGLLATDGRFKNRNLYAPLSNQANHLDVSLAFSSRIKFASSFSSKPVPSGVISAWIGAMSHVTPLTSQLILTRTQDGTALFAAGRAGLPYLLIQGTEDLCINPNQIEEEIKSFKDLTIKKLAGAGHILFYDALDETVQAILNFAGKHTVCLLTILFAYGGLNKTPSSNILDINSGSS